jgi:hypothetical protein
MEGKNCRFFKVHQKQASFRYITYYLYIENFDYQVFNQITDYSAIDKLNPLYFILERSIIFFPI